MSRGFDGGGSTRGFATGGATSRGFDGGGSTRGFATGGAMSRGFDGGGSTRGFATGGATSRGFGAGGSTRGFGAGGAAGRATSRGCGGACIGGCGAARGAGWAVGCDFGSPRPGFNPSSDHAGEPAASAAMKLIDTQAEVNRRRRTDGRLCIVRSRSLWVRVRCSARPRPRAAAE
jgi:hypothetical protein